MKKLMLVAALGAAFALTACGDDSSSNASSSGGNSKTKLDGKAVVSCDKISTLGGMETHSCYAIAADDAGVDAFKAKCAPISDLDKTKYTVGTGCAAASNACDTQEGGQVEYFYDEASSHFSCAELVGHNL